MEKITTQCSNCMVTMKVGLKFVGRQATCPKCSKSFTIQPIEDRSHSTEKIIDSTNTITNSYKENLIEGQRLIQQQRKLAQYFNKMVNERIQSETNANATLNNEKNSTNEQFEQFIRELEEKLCKIATIVEQAKDSLIEYWQKIVNKTTAPAIRFQNSKDPHKEIDRHINRIEKLFTKIQKLSNKPIGNGFIFWVSYWSLFVIYILSNFDTKNEYIEFVIRITLSLTSNFIPYSDI